MGYWNKEYWGARYYPWSYWPSTIRAKRVYELPDEAKPPVVKEYKSEIMMDLLMEGKSIFIGKQIIPEVELISYYTFIPSIDHDYLLGIDEELWILNQ